jgi:acyl-CoA thioester hydrolase
MDLSVFNNKISVHVRFNDVDMLGVCNNAVYINFFDEGRLSYMKEAGLVPETGLFTDGSLYFVVRNEINYRSYAHYGEDLNLYTRVSWIKNSSFGFEHVVENNNTKEIIADGSCVLVHVDAETRRPVTLPQSFIDKVTAYDIGISILKE